MKGSHIEWCDHTFNPWIGCTKVSPGCDHCYAEAREDKRLHRVQWGAGQPRHRTKTWGDPVRWNKEHAEFFAAHGRRQRVFCASLADVFDNEVNPEWRADLFDLIAKTPNLDWLLLTKRIGNAAAMIREAVNAHWRAEPASWPWPNVWLGATIVNQEEADRDIPKLLATPARVRFLSMEPLLGPVDLGRAGGVRIELGHPDPIGRIINQREAYPNGDPDGWIDWVIVGGESGPQARPMDPRWARDLRDQCAAAGMSFLFKQWGEWEPGTGPAGEGPTRHSFPDRLIATKVGKKAAGRLLDGVEHNGFPQGAAA